MKRLMPRVNDIAFYAFSQPPTTSTGRGADPEAPFTVAITRYFADDVRRRSQRRGRGRLGPYRGGLEYMMAAPATRSAAEERPACTCASASDRDAHVVAIRLATTRKRIRSTCTTLAMRLKGMGYEHLLPVPMKILASTATLHSCSRTRR